jgi:hypothetical protein
MLRKLRHYVLFDHKSRWQNDFASILMAVAWWAFRTLLFATPDQEAFSESLVVAVCCVGITTFLYSQIPVEKSKNRKMRSGQIDYERRRLIPRLALLVSAIIGIAAISLPFPSLEAAILDERLRHTFEGQLTPTNIEEGKQIVQTAQKYRLRASPALVSELGKHILDGSAEYPQLMQPALQATSAFASYRSTFVSLPRSSEMEVIQPVSGLDVGITAIGSQSENGALWEKPGSPGVKSNFQRVIFRVIHEEGAIYIDGAHIRNITFENANITYLGGPSNLESVQFVRCNFAIFVPNTNARRLIAAALSGDPVTLDLK